MQDKRCPDDKCNLVFVSKESHTGQRYDYKETTTLIYYKCDDCGRMYDERIKQTTIRPLAFAYYDKAQNLANQYNN